MFLHCTSPTPLDFFSPARNPDYEAALDSGSFFDAESLEFYFSPREFDFTRTTDFTAWSLHSFHPQIAVTIRFLYSKEIISLPICKTAGTLF